MSWSRAFRGSLVEKSRLPHDSDGIRVVVEAIGVDVEHQNAMVSHVRDEQTLKYRIVGNARRASESVRTDTTLTAIEVHLPDHEARGGITIETIGVDIEHQHPIVRRVGNEHALALFVESRRRHHPRSVGTNTALGGRKIFLADHDVRGLVFLDLVRMGAEHEDTIVEPVEPEQPLRRGIEDGDGAGEIQLVLARHRIRTTAVNAFTTDHVHRRAIGGKPVFSELEGAIPSVTVRGDEQPVMDRDPAPPVPVTTRYGTSARRWSTHR